MIILDNISKLRNLYESACEVDKALFAEQRTNIKLRNGEHYKNTSSKILNNVREAGINLTKEQKIRITKNHTLSITDEYINAILSRSPDVTVEAINSSDLSSIKDAEMSTSVLDWVKRTNNYSKKRQHLVHNTVVVGETYTTVAFDYSRGRVVGIDKKGNKVRAGEFVIKERMAYDTKRDPEAKSFDDCRFFFFDTLMDKTEAERLVGKYKPEMVESLKDANQGDTFVVFDSSVGSFHKESSKVLIIEVYVRPCPQYPDGQFIMMTKDFEIMRMPFPAGVFPVFQSGHSLVTSTPRYSSVMRVIRPYQIEINRASSKMAEHQITLGDDKIIIPNNGKLKSSGKESGIRVLSTDGAAPTVVAGRTGEQYLGYVNSEITGMYQAAKVGFLLEDKQVSGDPFALLFSTMKQRAKFVNYVSAYEEFEIDMFSAILKLAKHFLTEENMIRIVGKSEMVNIAEFQAIDVDSLNVKVVASNSDLETRFGKVISISQILQYAGSSMSQDQIGTLIRQLPYANKDEIFNPLTINYDTAVNMILALDRGETPNVPIYGDTDYLLKAIQGRTVKADFNALPPQVQSNYIGTIRQMEQIKAQQALQIQQAQAGMIPAGGFLVTVNASQANPTTGKVERIKIPSEAISWLAQKLYSQGVYARELESQPPQAQADLAQIVNTTNQQAPQVQGVQ